MPDEIQLMQQTAGGDRTAFQQLYALYSEKVLNTALHYTQNQEDAEEITQDVFLKIHQYSTSFKGNSSVSTWIYRIAVNSALTFIKRKKRFSFLRWPGKLPDEHPFEHPGVDEEDRDMLEPIYKAINELPDNQKTAFVLSYIEELPRQEVADIMELSLKAVESLLQRAKGNLRKKINILD